MALRKAQACTSQVVRRSFSKRRALEAAVLCWLAERLESRVLLTQTPDLTKEKTPWKEKTP